MSKATEKAPLGRKIMIIVILIIMPAMSWYYLSGGLHWRKQAVSELGAYGQIRGAYTLWPDGTKEDMLKDKVVVLHIYGENPDLTPENKKMLETSQELYKQFGKNKNFRIALIAEGGTVEFRSAVQTIPSIDYATWVRTGGLGSWRTIIENGYESFCIKTGSKPVPQYFVLADTAGIIRRYYDALDHAQVNRMVQQVALLLPQD